MIVFWKNFSILPLWSLLDFFSWILNSSFLESWNQTSLDSWIFLISSCWLNLEIILWAFCHQLCHYQNYLNQLDSSSWSLLLHDHLRIKLQSSDLIWGTKFCAPSLLLPPLIFSFLQALIHGFLWWWASSWLIFSLKWRLQSSFFLLHSAAIDIKEAKDSVDEEDPRPTSSTRSYIMMENEILCLKWGLNFEV